MYGQVDLSRFRSDIHSRFSPRSDALALDRRNFVRLALGTGAGLVVGGWLPATARAEGAAVRAQAGEGIFAPFVHITPDNVVTVLVKHQDKGQGIATGLSTLVADELDADWAQVKAEFAPANVELYKNLAFGIQGTGGSTAIANSFEQYRKAGAAARAMIVEAAAKRWGVAADTIKVEKGVVSSGNHRATLGELAKEAAAMPVPAEPKLKTPEQFTYIGKSFPRVDSVAKTTGARIYTQDVQLPGMLVATLARPPRFGGTVKSVDDKAARAVKGVVDVVTTGRGVAVLATSTYTAIKGREQLNVTWDDSKAEMRGTDALITEYKALADKPGLVARKEGDAEGALAKADKLIEATYIFPYLAHAPMEPMNCVLEFKDGKATLWTGSQLQTVDQGVVSAIFGIKPENVIINTLWAGGSFGRRGVYDSDYIAETSGDREDDRPQRADQARLDARGRHQGRLLPPGLCAQGARGAGQGRRHPRLAPPHRRAVDRHRHAVRSSHRQGWYRRHVGRGCVGHAVRDPQHAGRGAQHQRRAAAVVVAVGRAYAHGLRHGDDDRRGCRRLGQGPGGVPSVAAREAPAAYGRAQARGREGGLGYAAAGGRVPRRCGARELPQLRRRGGGGAPRRREAESRSRGRRRRLRAGGEPG
jgi:hypothetical protein